MSNLNISWLKQNLPEDCTIFYIGAADLHGAINIRSNFPNATIHAFEPGTYWLERHNILNTANEYNIVYHQLAVSDKEGSVLFYPCDKYGDDKWPVSSSLFEPTDALNFLTFSEPVEVQSTTLDVFCEQQKIFPDFIHIDAQGAEFSIFSHLGNHRPRLIWTEICEFDRYKTGVTYHDFYNLMISLGYKKIFTDGPDELYGLESLEVSEYITNDRNHKK